MDRRALIGYSTPQQREPSAIHTDVYDRDKSLLARLEPLTVNERRLFRQGGAEAVIEDRRFYARERGDERWKEITLESPWSVQERARRAEASGAKAGSSKPLTGLPLAMSRLSQAVRPGEREPGADAGPDGGPAEATTGDATGRGTAAQGTAGVREGIRPGEERVRPTDREPERSSETTEPVSSVRRGDPARVEAGDGQGVEAKKPVKRGRPRKWADDRARNRAAMRAYRERRRER